LFWPLHQCHESSWRPLCSAAQFLRMIDEINRELSFAIVYNHLALQMQGVAKVKLLDKNGSRTRTLKPPSAPQNLYHI
jgi:hypothetical protein